MAEIQQILAAYPQLTAISLADLDMAESPAEDDLERYDTFRENAAAKAQYFAALSGILTLADDSGLCVDALNGLPGVHSRRFAPDPLLRGEAQDAANNAHLLSLLADAARPRTAAYECSVAIAEPGAPPVFFAGRCAGEIIDRPQGSGGFGYDPLFRLPGRGRTFAELAPSQKNQLSHRGQAFRAAAEYLISRG